MIEYPYKVNALRISQPLGEFYVAALPARLLLDVAFSDAMEARVDENNGGYDVDGTQRVYQLKRLSQIGDYIDREDSAFPNSIILAANYRKDGLIEDEDLDLDEEGVSGKEDHRRWSVEENDGKLELFIPSARKLAAIIDGQHRLFGFTKSDRGDRLDMELLCSIYLDLPKPYQAQLFATINSTQKSVDKSLTYELFGYNISEEDPVYWSPDKLAVFFTRRLGTEEGSPLRGHISIAPKKGPTLEELGKGVEWKVSTAVVVEGIMRLFSVNPKRDTQFLLTPSKKKRDELISGARDKSVLRDLYINGNDALIYQVVVSFLHACQDVFWAEAPDGSFIRKTVGVQALFDILRKHLVASAMEAKNVSRKFFVEKLEPAKEIDFLADRFRNASGSGRTIIRKAIEQELGLE